MHGFGVVSCPDGPILACEFENHRERGLGVLYNSSTKEVLLGEFDASDDYETVCSFGDYEFPGPT